MQGYNFEYYYGHEADQYSFYRIPKALFSDEIFSELSCEAKVLYGLMLDRMGLSMRNNWIDENNRVYIYFTLEDAQKAMRCGKEKGVKLFAELDTEKGIGLIERKKQGMGRPTRIYVKSFLIGRYNEPDSIISEKEPEKTPQNKEVGKSKVKTSEKPKSSLPNSRPLEVGKTEVKTSEKPKSLLPENRPQDFGKSDPNNTNINNTELSDNDFNNNDSNDIKYQSIHQSINPINQATAKKVSETKTQQTDTAIDAYEAYREIIKDNIDYDYLCLDRFRKEDVDEIVEIMLEATCSTKKYLRVNNENVPASIVKSRMLKLEHQHIEYLLETMRSNTTKVNNIRSYLLTAIYNSFTSISHYYRAEVNHDLYG